MKLGLFDPKDKTANPYFNFGISEIDSPEHQQLALEAAQQAVVLLKNAAVGKNAEAVLPLKNGLKIAVVGPHMNATRAFLSNYHGSRCLNGKPGDGKDFSCIQTPLAAITAANTMGATTGATGATVAGKKDIFAFASVSL